jgi:hypothetical protein
MGSDSQLTTIGSDTSSRATADDTMRAIVQDSLGPPTYYTSPGSPHPRLGTTMCSYALRGLASISVIGIS